MNRLTKGTRRSFLTGISGIFASSVFAGNILGQSTKEDYPIGLPLKQIWELQVTDHFGDAGGSISLGGIHQDTIYLVEARDSTDRILAFEKASNDPLWELYYDGSLVSPIVVGDKLFAGGEKEFLAYGLESEPDEPNWDVRIDEGFVWDTTSDGDTVWFTDYTVDRTGDQGNTLEISSGTLYAYTKDGTQKWSVSRGFGRVVEYDGSLYETSETWRKETTEESYTQFGGRAVVRDADSGKIKWRSEDLDIKRVHPPYSQDVVVALSTDGTIYGYDASSGKLQWQHAAGSEVSDITTNERYVFYAVDQRLAAYNPSTNEIDWRQRIPPAYDLTYNQKLLYVGDQNGNFHAFDATTGNRVWNHSLEGTAVGYERVVDGTVYCVSGSWLAVFQGKQGRALSKLQDLRSKSTLGTSIANPLGRKEALATAEKEIENHNYEKAFAALNRAELLGTGGDGAVWTTGAGTAYVAGRRATHEYKRHQFQELVEELTTVYPISNGVLKGTAPDELIQTATHALDQLSDTRLGRPVTAGWVREDDYNDLQRTIIAAADVAPRLRDASSNLESVPDELQEKWITTLEEAISAQKFDAVAQKLDQLETGIELTNLRDEVNNSESSLDTRKISNFIDSLLAPDVEPDESDIVHCEVAATAISDYQSAKTTLHNYDLSGVLDKLNESLKANEKSRDTATRNLKRVQRLLDKATFVESKRQTLNLQYISLSPEELQADLQYCLSEPSLDELEELATLVENLDAGVWRREHFGEFTPVEFEHLVASLYGSQGYDTQVSQASNDKGIDVTVRGETETLAIQVKQYSRRNKVGRPTVQQLAGARDQVNANKGVIVTSSSFTETAQSASQSYGASMELINGQQLLEMLTKSPISPPSGTSWNHSPGDRSGTSSQNSTGHRQSAGNSTNTGHANQGSYRNSTGGPGGNTSQFCMSCGQEYRGSLYEVTDPSGQPMYVCARCKELLEQSAAHQAAAKQEAYEILGVEPDASQEDIEAAYRERARETHPDTGGSKEEFLEVQEAYETLSESMNS